MRCPKCGFVSYDLSESCVKCRKNISTAAKEVQGTVASVAAPTFLRFGFAGTGAEAAQVGEAEAEVTFDLGGEGEEVVIDLGTEEASTLESQPLDLGLAETAAAPVELGEPEGEPTAEEPAFALPTEEPPSEGFEISDLAPPQEAALPVEEELIAEEESVAAEEPISAGAGLADLKVEGIDLEASPAKGKAVPSVKTGTALDEFDINLDDLIPKKK